uniref:Deoxyribodipyrimidine photo-lyase n=1 Tax=Lingulaulax polyedra TaxID=160621 RepID=A0A516AGD8_LINPO|nr:CPD photolyase [Lingulodinium polyedra]
MPPRKKASAPKGKAAAAEDRKDDGSGDVSGGVVDWRRRRLLTPGVPAAGAAMEGKAVLYWMSRDQRVQDNWALLHARDLAKAAGGQLLVAFCLVPRFLEATIRQFDFMLRGLREVETELRELKIPFELLLCEYGSHAKSILGLCEQRGVGAVVCDMSPLRVPKAWTAEVAATLGKAGVSCVQVDAHNVVPVWQASSKQETAARTIRSKITLQYGEFLKEIPAFEPMAKQEAGKPVDWEKAEASLVVDRTVAPVPGIEPGAKAAMQRLHEFCKKRLGMFAEQRNNPNADALSGLSPYLHFGQISAQRCALAVRAAEEDQSAGAAVAKGCESFLEEAIVRRELSDNFCWYQEKYDSLEGAAGWAQETLRVHEQDKREHLYSEEELEAARTHDDLWNAAQLQMVREGKMHGFLRMYWAKKILEWTSGPEEALRIAIRLNDRYELDGRDPNGYVGCMWSICGIHDMGWTERPIFGKIRFMNYAGCKRKFSIPNFVSRYPSSLGASMPAKVVEEPPAKRSKKA